jgi:hypothetical protein
MAALPADVVPSIILDAFLFSRLHQDHAVYEKPADELTVRRARWRVTAVSGSPGAQPCGTLFGRLFNFQPLPAASLV